MTFAEVSVDPHARAITDAELASIHTPNAHATQEDAEDRRAAATFNPLEQALLGFSPAPSPIAEPHRMAEKIGRAHV